MKIIQEGKASQNFKKHFNILNVFLKSTNCALINKKLLEVSSVKDESLLQSEIY